MIAVDYVRLLNEMRLKGYEHPDVKPKVDSMNMSEGYIFCIYDNGHNIYNGERQIVDLYYDAYEKNFGDGYFCSSEHESHCDSVKTHVFQIHNDMWIQISGDCIDGLDGDNGINLLDKLNGTKELQIIAKLCLNRIKSEKDVVRAKPNDLSKPEFVCKVVDEMINCAWKAQAEEILSYVGGKYNCKGIINRYGKCVYQKTKHI